MYVIKTRSEFDSAHFLKDYEGKCANIHGHRWIVTVDVGSETIEESGPYRGMVVDFGKLKADLKEETEKDPVDHLGLCLRADDGIDADDTAGDPGRAPQRDRHAGRGEHHAGIRREL